MQSNQIIALACCLFIAACSTVKDSIETKVQQIAPGMSSAQVESLLGPPPNRQFNGRMEAWQYCQPVRNIAEQDTLILIWINNGSVTGMQSLSVPRRGVTCRDPSFQTVNWQQAPDATVEIRSR
jgi:outer membrane protein assembly factor BamE (lipoprotein component of BamABCDE complex)